MWIPIVSLAIFLPLVSTSPAPTPTVLSPITLVDRQASTTTITTLHGTCHTSTPTSNVPRGICTITAPADSIWFNRGLGCNNGIIDGLRLFNCSSDGSVTIPSCEGALFLKLM